MAGLQVCQGPEAKTETLHAKWLEHYEAGVNTWPLPTSERLGMITGKPVQTPPCVYAHVSREALKRTFRFELPMVRAFGFIAR